jgi:SH3-like domain-containing protein
MRRAFLLAVVLITAPAWGQTLRLPPKDAPAAAEVNPANHPPTAVPRQAVTQVAPLASPTLLGQSSPGRPPPVVQAPKGAHAERPSSPKQPVTAAGKPKEITVVPPIPPPLAPAPRTVPAAKPAPAPAEGTAKPPAPTVGSVTHLPLPRFASLRSDEVNLRSGPGFRYPIEWVYRRRDLPVEILREYDEWRLVSDPDGVKGWVHAATLTGRRGFVVKSREEVLRREPAETAGAVALLKPGVIGRLRACKAGSEWCQVQVADYRGWVRRADIWGVAAGEAIK